MFSPYINYKSKNVFLLSSLLFIRIETRESYWVRHINNKLYVIKYIRFVVTPLVIKKIEFLS